MLMHASGLLSIDIWALWHVRRPPNVPRYLREQVGVFADRLRFLFAVKWLIVVRRAVLPSIDTMQCMAPDNLYTTDLERTADQ